MRAVLVAFRAARRTWILALLVAGLAGPAGRLAGALAILRTALLIIATTGGAAMPIAVSAIAVSAIAVSAIAVSAIAVSAIAGALVGRIVAATATRAVVAAGAAAAVLTMAVRITLTLGRLAPVPGSAPLGRRTGFGNCSRAAHTPDQQAGRDKAGRRCDARTRTHVGTTPRAIGPDRPDNASILAQPPRVIC